MRAIIGHAPAEDAIGSNRAAQGTLRSVLFLGADTPLGLVYLGFGYFGYVHAGQTAVRCYLGLS
jgi:hypothetical protein